MTDTLRIILAVFIAWLILDYSQVSRFTIDEVHGIIFVVEYKEYIWEGWLR